MNLDPFVIRQQISDLKVLHPELLEDDEAWELSLESETNIDDLLTKIVRRIEDTKALVIGTKERFEELKARKERFEGRIDGLRSLLFKMMEAANLKKRELPEATLSIRQGQPKLLGEPDIDKLPENCRKVTVTADRAEIKKALEGGVSIEGCQLSNGEPSISIRIK